MTTFLLDLWQDLRAKRLWPIAVALVAGTVAVPVLLLKPASPAPRSTGTGQAANGAKLPTVALDASSVTNSHLDVFKAKNPFASGSDQASVATSGSTAASTVGSSVASGASSAGGGTPASTTSGGSTKPVIGPDGKPVSPGIHYFTYTVDVRFGLRSNLKSYKGVKQLDLLPDGQTPVVAFMGVRDAKTAVFMITDPAFKADGEGTCRPTPQNCLFLDLRLDSAHDEETLSAQGGQVEYSLRLTGLHVKSLSKSQALGKATPDKSGKAAAKNAKAYSKGLTNEPATLLSLPGLGLAKR